MASNELRGVIIAPSSRIKCFLQSVMNMNKGVASNEALTGYLCSHDISCKIMVNNVETRVIMSYVCSEEIERFDSSVVPKYIFISDELRNISDVVAYLDKNLPPIKEGDAESKKVKDAESKKKIILLPCSYGLKYNGANKDILNCQSTIINWTNFGGYKPIPEDKTLYDPTIYNAVVNKFKGCTKNPYLMIQIPFIVTLTDNGYGATTNREEYIAKVADIFNQNKQLGEASISITKLSSILSDCYEEFADTIAAAKPNSTDSVPVVEQTAAEQTAAEVTPPVVEPIATASVPVVEQSVAEQSATDANAEVKTKDVKSQSITIKCGLDLKTFVVGETYKSYSDDKPTTYKLTRATKNSPDNYDYTLTFSKNGNDAITTTKTSLKNADNNFLCDLTEYLASTESVLPTVVEPAAEPAAEPAVVAPDTSELKTETAVNDNAYSQQPTVVTNTSNVSVKNSETGEKVYVFSCSKNGESRIINFMVGKGYTKEGFQSNLYNLKDVKEEGGIYTFTFSFYNNNTFQKEIYKSPPKDNTFLCDLKEDISKGGSRTRRIKRTNKILSKKRKTNKTKKMKKHWGKRITVNKKRGNKKTHKK